MYHDSRQNPDLRRARSAEVRALIVARDSEALSLRRALESGGDRFPHFGLDVVDSAEDAIERLGGAKYDAVILDLDHPGGITQGKLHTVRERANGATLFLTGGEQTGIAGTIIGDEEWVERGTSKALITVGEVVDKVLRIGKPLDVEKGLDVRVDVVEPDSSIRTDAEKLRQVLLNMLTNAVKFTDEGAIDLRVNVRPNEVVFEGADTGIGIAQEDLEGIFEPFRQVEQGTTRRAGGTGLGLNVARKLAGLLGGTLQVASEPGRGSTFVLQIPRDFAPESGEVDASGADAEP